MAVPCALSASVQASKVDTDFDHLLSHSDHDAVCVSLRLRCVSKGRQPAAPRRLHVDPAVQAVWQAEVAAAPLAPWACSVDSHQCQLSATLRTASRRCALDGFPLSGGVKPFVTSEVLQGLRLRKHLRRVLRAEEGCHTSAFLRVAFQAWQAGISRDPSDIELRLSAAKATRHLLSRLRVACALHLRAFALAASQTRALRAAKAAYLDELGLIFEGASREKDTKTLFAALKSLVPSLRGGKGFRCAFSVRDEHGLPFPDLERAAAGWSQHFGKAEGGVLVSREFLEDQYIHHAEAQRQLEACCLEHLPDLLAWEAQFRAIRPGKALGPDGLGSTLSSWLSRRWHFTPTP